MEGWTHSNLGWVAGELRFAISVHALEFMLSARFLLSALKLVPCREILSA